MKKNLLIIIIILIIAGGGFLIYNLSPKMITSEAGGRLCWWVYKTNGDYFDLHGVQFISEKFDTVAILPHGPRTQTKLAQSYIGSQDSSPLHPYFAFIDISISEYKEAKNDFKNECRDCWSLAKPFAHAIISEECNEIDFDDFVYEDVWGKEVANIGTIGSVSREEGVAGSDHFFIQYTNKEGNKDSCDTTLSSEEKNEFKEIIEDVNSCIDSIPQPAIFDNLVNENYLINNIVDKEPFTEFYLCYVESIDDVNEIINNNELDTKCERKI